jgi:nitrite reductase/ring-hydroxylating ferredoxin subunit
MMNNQTYETLTWFPACKIEDVPENGGACVKYKHMQIAVFNFTGAENGMPLRICVRTACRWHLAAV